MPDLTDIQTHEYSLPVPAQPGDGEDHDALDPTAPCASQYFSYWMMKPDVLREYVAAVRDGAIKIRRQQTTAANDTEHSFDLTSDGIALLNIEGTTMKGSSKFGGTSTLALRSQLREVVRSDKVRGVMINIDSPGGTVAGTEALANEIAATTRVKPVHAHVPDLAASAAIWIMSQVDRVTTSKSAQMGSIGVITSITDESEAAEKMGVKVHVITTSPRKAAGVPGAPVTDEHVAQIQEEVNAINDVFVDAIANSPRSIDIDGVKTLNDGRMLIGSKAVDAGLADSIEDFDQALESLRQEATMPNGSNGNTGATVDFANLDAESLRENAPRIVEQIEQNAQSNERQRMADLEAKFGDRPEFVIEQFKKGSSVSDAAVPYAELCKSDLETARKKAASNKPNRAEEEVSGETDGSDAVAVNASSADDEAAKQMAETGETADQQQPDPSENPKAYAEWEWDNDVESCKSAGRFTSKERYANIRSRELQGRFRQMGRG